MKTTPSSKSTRKLWLGLGACLIVTGAGAPAIAASPPGAGGLAEHLAASTAMSPDHGLSADTSSTLRLANAKGGGEGGEGGERGQGGEKGTEALERLTPEERLTVQLLLMKGHLRIGKELLDAGRTDNAREHFGHPMAEVYEDSRPALVKRGVKGLRRNLVALTEAMEGNRSQAAVAESYGRAVAAIDRALATIDGATRATPRFIHTVALALLSSALEEYEESVKGDKIADLHEFQDARGFVLVARDWVAAHAAALEARDPDAYQQVARHIDAVAAVIAPAVPTAATKADVSKVAGAVSRVALASSSFR